MTSKQKNDQNVPPANDFLVVIRSLHERSSAAVVADAVDLGKQRRHVVLAAVDESNVVARATRRAHTIVVDIRVSKHLLRVINLKISDIPTAADLVGKNPLGQVDVDHKVELRHLLECLGLGNIARESVLCSIVLVSSAKCLCTDTPSPLTRMKPRLASGLARRFSTYYIAFDIKNLHCVAIVDVHAAPTMSMTISSGTRAPRSLYACIQHKSSSDISLTTQNTS